MSTTAPISASNQRAPALQGQTVVLIGGSAGIGLETARLARAEGADVIITGRNPERLERAAEELGAVASAAFDATDSAKLESFFESLTSPIDHVLDTAGGPYYAPLAEIDFARALQGLDDKVLGTMRVARYARERVRPGGTLLFMGGTGGRHPAVGGSLSQAVTVALPTLIAGLALEIAPVRVNLIAAGFVDTKLSAEILGDGLEARRQQLRETLPIGRVVGPADVAAVAIHVMENTALTGATFDVDGGQQISIGSWG
jgi:NAD(P)-dependent dehydrogenase (short-subunit alcohol dehydrogenase family)